MLTVFVGWMALQFQAQAGAPATFTLCQLADSVWVADSLANFQAYDAKLHSRLVSSVWSLRKMAQKSDDITFADELKSTRPEALTEKPADMGKVLLDVEFLKTVSINELKDALTQANVPVERILSLREPVTAFQRNEIKAAYNQSRNRLFRYEQRYGKHAPELNLVEAGVAYLLQGLYPFGPDDTGPGSLEPVIRYSTSYALAYHEKIDDLPRQFTVAALWEFGLRWYWYSAPEARPSFLALLKPEYIAAGYAMSPSKREWFFLINDESFDPGAFLDVGVFKVAWTFGKYRRFYIGRQFQFVPHLF